jgi:serine/threonine protein phosphatase PrpC
MNSIYYVVLAICSAILIITEIVLAVRQKKQSVKPSPAVNISEAAPVIVCVPPLEPCKPPITIGNAHHIGSRDSQQDKFAISDVSNADLCRRKGIFAIVADGMGGMASGGEASSIASQTCLKYFNENEISGHPELDLLNMLFAANDNVTRFMQGGEQGGSTAVAVIIRGVSLYWASVGDSRIYLIRNGTITQLNREDTYAVELDEKAASGETSWEQAASDPKRAALTNYLGIGKLENVDRSFRPTQLLVGDRILLMSDGVFGTISDNEILSTMSMTAPESAAKIQELVLSKQKPYQDNLTAIIFEFNGERT